MIESRWFGKGYMIGRRQFGECLVKVGQLGLLGELDYYRDS